MEQGKTIELFLVNGTADSLVEAELSNWSGKAIRIPRSEVAACKLDDITHPGVYFLFSKDDDNNDAVYIGEAENVKERLLQHMRDYEKDTEEYYWTMAVIFTGRDLNKAHIRYLENRFVGMALESRRYNILTKKTYTNTVLKRSQISVMEAFIDNVKVVINALGYKVLEPLRVERTEIRTTNIEEAEELHIRSNNGEYDAKGIVTNEGFVLFKDSRIRKQIADNVKKRLQRLREEYEEEGKLNDLITTADILFSSSSEAACFVKGSSVSGPQAWKNKDGVTLKDIEAQARKLAEEQAKEDKEAPTPE